MHNAHACSYYLIKDDDKEIFGFDSRPADWRDRGGAAAGDRA